jgi:Arc/MetJ-type ribon-helix-helix transcriptional regulator
MQTTTVRVSKQTHAQLRLLSQQIGESMQDVIAKAVELYQEQIFWQEVREAYARLRHDPQAWQEELEERRLWENTLMDGLEEE